MIIKVFRFNLGNLIAMILETMLQAVYKILLKIIICLLAKYSQLIFNNNYKDPFY